MKTSNASASGRQVRLIRRWLAFFMVALLISGLTAVHQGVRIGGYSMTGGGAKISQDVAPFVIAGRESARLWGLNKVGLKRNGFPREKIQILEKVYKIFFRSGLGLKDAVAAIGFIA